MSECKCPNGCHEEMVCPIEVTSPKNKFMKLNEVLVNTGPTGFTLAKIQWDDAADGSDEEVLAIRWNGYREPDKSLNKGHPVIRGYPTWFIIPVELEKIFLIDSENYLSKITPRNFHN